MTTEEHVRGLVQHWTKSEHGGDGIVSVWWYQDEERVRIVGVSNDFVSDQRQPIDRTLHYPAGELPFPLTVTWATPSQWKRRKCIWPPGLDVSRLAKLALPARATASKAPAGSAR